MYPCIQSNPLLDDYDSQPLANMSNRVTTDMKVVVTLSTEITSTPSVGATPAKLFLIRDFTSATRRYVAVRQTGKSVLFTFILSDKYNASGGIEIKYF